MPIKGGIYLDSNAGAPLKPNVLEVLFPLLKRGETHSLIPNPSSIHSYGRVAKRWIALAREQVAHSLGAHTDPEQLVFVSSGTEANQLAIRSVLEPLLLSGKRPHWITTAVEHDSNLQMVDWVKARGGSVSILPVDVQGQVSVEMLQESWKPETVLVSAVWVNNETGVISPIEAISSMVRKKGALLHLDAAQAWGKLPIDVAATGAHLISFSGHKIGALAGTGVLWVNRGIRIQPAQLGKQEKGRRGGTENVLGIVAMGAAALQLDPLAWSKRVNPLRTRLEDAICQRILGAHINGGGALRVANTLNMGFDGVEGDSLVMALDLAGYSVSSGSACSSGALEPSHVLMAMGRSKLEAMAGLRISLADEMPWEDLEGFVRELETIVSRVRNRKDENEKCRESTLHR